MIEIPMWLFIVGTIGLLFSMGTVVFLAWVISGIGPKF